MRILITFLMAWVMIFGNVIEIKGGSISITVPGMANPWLAGMPDSTHSTVNSNDVVPDQAPVLVTGLILTPGEAILFSATGLTSNDGPANTGPDGNIGWTTNHVDEYGISGIQDDMPLCVLIGVFLDSQQPDISVTPVQLDFGTTESRNFEFLTPQLKQVFFIGDGFNDSNYQQRFYLPSGAERLYLGIMDGGGWYNNQGSFEVQIVPEPSSAIILGIGFFSLFAFFWHKRNSIM